MNGNGSSYFKGLRGKIGLQMLAVGIVPILLVGTLVLWNMFSSQMQASEKVDESRSQLETEVVGITLESMASTIAREFNQFMEERAGDLRQWAEEPAVFEAARAGTVNVTEVNEYLHREMTLSVYVGGLTLTEGQGLVLNAVDSTGVNATMLGADQSSCEWWVGAWEEGNHLGASAYVAQYQAYVQNIATQVLDPDTGQKVGVLGAVLFIPVDAIGDEYVQRMSEGRIVVLWGDGRIAQDTGDKSRHLEEVPSLRPTEQAVMARIAAGEKSGYVIAEGSVAGFTATRGMGFPKVYSLPGYETIDEIVIAEQSEEIAFAPLDGLVELESDLDDSARNMTYTLVVVLLAVALGALAIAVWLSRSITKPVMDLRDAAEKISKGDMDVTIDVTTKDEIGDLAESFSRMVTAVKFLSQDEDV